MMLNLEINDNSEIGMFEDSTIMFCTNLYTFDNLFATYKYNIVIVHFSAKRLSALSTAGFNIHSTVMTA